MVASYIMFVVVHFPGSGHSALYRQLQVQSCFFALVVMLVLWALIFVSLLLIQLQLTCTVLPMIFLCNWWSFGKCLSNRDRKFFSGVAFDVFDVWWVESGNIPLLVSFFCFFLLFCCCFQIRVCEVVLVACGTLLLRSSGTRPWFH